MGPQEGMALSAFHALKCCLAGIAFTSPGKVKRAWSDTPVALLLQSVFDDEGHLDNFFQNISVPEITFSSAFPLNCGYQ